MSERSQEGVHGALHDLLDLLAGKRLAVGSGLFPENPTIEHLHEVAGGSFRLLNCQGTSACQFGQVVADDGHCRRLDNLVKSAGQHRESSAFHDDHA